MASKRMFDSDIVTSDAFRLMSTEAQAYYFQCNFQADDRGYVSGARSLEKLYKPGVLQELIDKRFILQRPKDLYLIKHFLIHNYIRPEILEETINLNDFKYLYIKPNGAYTDIEKENCVSIKELLENHKSLYVGKPLRKGKVRLGKVSSGKSKVSNNNISNNQSVNQSNDIEEDYDNRPF